MHGGHQNNQCKGHLPQLLAQSHCGQTAEVSLENGSHLGVATVHQVNGSIEGFGLKRVHFGAGRNGVAEWQDVVILKIWLHKSNAN